MLTSKQRGKPMLNPIRRGKPILTSIHCKVTNLSPNYQIIMKRIDSKLQLISAVVLIVLGAGLLIAGFIVPPTGVIDNSVLIAFGEILTFVGSLFGIDYHYKYKNK